MGFYGNATYYLPNGIAQDVVDGIITTKKLADNAVTKSKIAPKAIHGSEGTKSNSKDEHSSHIASKSIGTDDIADNAVTGGAELPSGRNIIAPHTITGYNISYGTIDGSGDKNGANNMEDSHIGENTIGLSNMGKDSVGTDQIIDSSIKTDKINNLAITREKIKGQAIGYLEIEPENVYGRAFTNSDEADSVQKIYSHIKECSIAGGENGDIAPNTIQQYNMANSSIGTDQIIDDSINSYKIADYQIHGCGDNSTYQHIAAGSIGKEDLADQSVWKQKIAATAITGLGAVSENLVSPIKENGRPSHFASRTIAGEKHSHDDDNTHLPGDIALDTITGGSEKGKGNIAGGTIQGYNIADEAINTKHIFEGAVTTDKIDYDAITMDELDIHSVHGLKGEKSRNGKKSHIFPETIAGGEGGDIAPGTITNYNIDSISKAKINDMNCYEPVILNSKSYVSVYSLIQILKTFEISSPIFITQGVISFDSRELPAGKYFIIPLSNTSWIFFNQKINTFYEIQDDTDKWVEGQDINSYITIFGKNWAMEPYRERTISAITSVVSNWDQYSSYTTYCEILNIVGESNLNSWNSEEEHVNSKATAPLPGKYLTIMLKRYAINSIYFIGLDHSHQYLSSYNTEHSSWLTQEITKSKIEISTFNKKELVSGGPQQNCQLQLNIQPNTVYYLDQAYDETLYYPFKYEGYNYIQLFKSEIFSQENNATIYCSLPDEGSFIQNKTNLPMYCSLSGLPNIIVNIDGTIVSNDILNKIYGTSTHYNIIMTIQQVKIQGLDALQCQIMPWSDLLTYEDFYKE